MQDKAWACEVLSLIEKKYRAVAERNHDRIPYTCINGRFDDWSGPDRICWWTNGF